MVFQDSYSSLNPRMPVQDSVAFGPFVHGRSKPDARRVARDMLVKVGLNPDLFGPRYPHELSGGQKQRVNIARALAIEPRMVILDEAVSALDKSVEAQVLNLLRALKQQFNLTYLFISHDLNVVRYVSDRVLVMYLGRVVELGPSEDIFTRPLHPYTRALLGSRPSMDPATSHRGAADHRRPAKPDRSAVRLPLSHALSVRRGGMRGTVAGTGRVARTRIRTSPPATCWNRAPATRGQCNDGACRSQRPLRPLCHPRSDGACGEWRQLQRPAGRGAVHPG